MKKTNIVLSSFNGEKYIAEQIESIIGQTYQDWQLLIRDDGSTDRTREIVKSYEQRDSRIRLINPETTENIGLVSSFYELVKSERADYYFFSDQDDVWLPEKLEVTLESLRKAKLSAMVYTDLKVVDAELNVVSESYLAPNPYINTSLKDQILTNNVVGGVSAINHALAELWTTDQVFIHDWYLGLLAAAFGELIYLDLPTELYRQHAANVVGANQKATTMQAIKEARQQSSGFLSNYWAYFDKIKQLNLALLNSQGDKLSQEKRQLIEAFVSLDEASFFKRLKVFKFSRKNWRATVIFRLLYLTKLGRKS
ncbi:glycosyltransferase family 2 protein [Lactococcus termiticola]|uniref:Alpha-L-Rha alpha-1,3-L-rhamnosyltransferase n=1 Tax=Lactococcus termiticola TaxID=2169526 RepID=A0A2R5HGS5_9LACT|nr:glycosyltransferase family 2 protein [Lactococcus termiticola]GBG97263.1 alpha-L-Rha alpha-1,3-L-rhamnosyltransferase [Lactococcus termiticola]